MHIAMIGWIKGHPHNVKTLKYGGIERMTATLSRNLARIGQRVTLIAPTGSAVEGVKTIPCDNILGVPDIVNSLSCDVIHDNTCWSIESPVRRHLNRPFLSTTHVNHAIGWTKNVVYLSNAQRTQHQIQSGVDLTDSPIIRVPIDPDLGIFFGEMRDRQSSYCLFIGSITEHKGVLEAAYAAKALGKSLVIIGDIPSGGDYYKKLRDMSHVSFVGPMQQLERDGWIRNAYAVMCLHNNHNGWCEPGCGIVGEANGLNVPVMALHNGCLTELIINKVNGWIADDWESLVDMVKEYPTINTSRTYANTVWNMGLVVNRYLKLYNDLLLGKTWG